jgi:hypothetical protein
MRQIKFRGILKHAIVCEVVGNIHDNPELMNVPNERTV